MGYLMYQGQSVEFEDRTLAHVQTIVIDKLRHGESFAFSWTDPVSAGSGRGCLWLHPRTDLMFRYSGSRMPTLNRDWLEILHLKADSNQGLMLDEKATEPEEHVRAA